MIAKIVFTGLFVIASLVFSPVFANTMTNGKTNGNGNQQQPSDATITSSVKNKLSSDNLLKNTSFKVSTVDGVVTLTGNADTADQLSIATQDAQSVKGVQDVDVGQVVVAKESQQPFTDSLITAKVKGMYIQKDLFSDKDIASWTVSVETNDGVVTLTGTADNQDQINNANKIAKSVKGVKEVKSAVTIKAS